MMTRIRAGLTGKLSLALGVALLAVLVLTLSVSAKPAEPLVDPIPQVPHCFYGSVVTTRGKLLPDAPVVAEARTARVTTTTDAQSRYGYQPQFCIPVYNPVTGIGANVGDVISFSVHGALSATAIFNPDGVNPMMLNLVVPLQYLITPTAGPNGAITPSQPVLVDYGFDQTFTFTPNNNYLILDVLIDGVSDPAAVSAGSYTFTNVTRAHTIHVTFVRATYLIMPIAGTGCTITPSTQQVVPYKGSSVFNIAANTGYDLVDVKVDGASHGPILSYTFSNVVADHTIEATCKLKDFVITPIWGAGGSIVPGTPQSVSYGGSVKFEIVPSVGYLVDNVIVNGVSQGAISEYIFTNVTGNGTIAATFKAQTLTVTPTAGPGGTISPNTVQTVSYGGSVTFNITPNPGYKTLDVKVNGASQGPLWTYTFTNVTANGTIEVIFLKVNHRLLHPAIYR
jgi:hypothetical protein